MFSRKVVDMMLPRMGFSLSAQPIARARPSVTIGVSRPMTIAPGTSSAGARSVASTSRKAGILPRQQNRSDEECADG